MEALALGIVFALLPAARTVACGRVGGGSRASPRVPRVPEVVSIPGRCWVCQAYPHEDQIGEPEGCNAEPRSRVHSWALNMQYGRASAVNIRAQGFCGDRRDHASASVGTSRPPCPAPHRECVHSVRDTEDWQWRSASVEVGRSLPPTPTRSVSKSSGVERASLDRIESGASATPDNRSGIDTGCFGLRGLCSGSVGLCIGGRLDGLLGTGHPSPPIGLMGVPTLFGELSQGHRRGFRKEGR